MVCREKFNFYKTVEVCHVTLIELMRVDGNDVSTGIHFFCGMSYVSSSKFPHVVGRDLDTCLFYCFAE